MYLIGGLLMIALGLFMLLRPDDFFDLTEILKSEAPGEPSPGYRCSTRFAVSCSASWV
ncbi:MAG: DUF6199 family natural product biosynthesis protein [Oscillospiraceae bacterium]